MTGIASNEVFKYDPRQATEVVINTNKTIAELIGINSAARTTCIKPSGTTSLVLGVSSGIHAWHNDYYIRRMQMNKSEAIYEYLSANHPEIIQDYKMIPNSAVVEIPIRAPKNATIRNKETALELLDKVKTLNETWIKPGHNAGENTHNISATISVKDNEWESVGNWMWDNRSCFNGLSVLPYDGGSYIQAPFEDITKEQYDELIKHVHSIDLTKVIEADDNTTLVDEVACGASGCEVK